MLYLIRHAEAGDKHLWSGWHGDDAARPITALGRLQSDALVSVLTPYPIGRIVSSPTARCVQTVEPLARRRGVPIHLDRDLAVEAAPEVVLALASRAAGEAAVLCTHGEVIKELLGALFAGGVARPPGRLRSQKGSVWVIGRLDGDSPVAHYLPPSPG